MRKVIQNKLSYPRFVARQTITTGIHMVQSFALLFTRPPLSKLALQAAGVTVVGCFIMGSAHAKDGDSKYPECKLLPSGQSVVYQPGVDVNGNAVVAADLNTNPLSSNPMGDALNVIKAPLTLDLAQRVVALGGTGIEMNAPLGMMEIHQDGRVLYNGLDITKPVMTLCGKSHKEVTVEVIEVEKPVAPVQPEEPVAVEEPSVEVYEQALPNELAVETPKEAIQMPAVSAPEVEMLDELTPTKIRMENMTRPKVSEPAAPIKPLIGIPKGNTNTTTSDVLQGSEHKDYNE